MVERDGMGWNGLGWVRQGKAAPVRCAFFWSVHPCPRCPAGGGGRSTNESVGTKQIFWFIAAIQTVIRYESAASSPFPDLPLFLLLWHSPGAFSVFVDCGSCVCGLCAHIRLDLLF